MLTRYIIRFNLSGGKLMIEKILEYSGLIFAAVGIICLFLEAFETFKRKANSKLTIAGLVFLTVSVIGFIITEVILRESDVSYFFTVTWIALLWVYLICNIVSAALVSRKKRSQKRSQNGEQSDVAEHDDQDVKDKEDK